MLGGRLYYIATFPSRVVRAIFHRTHEPEMALLPQFVKSGAVCLDIGAHHGDYTRALSTLAGTSGVVHAVEPVRYNCQVLQAVLNGSRLGNAKVHRLAIAGRTGTASIVVPTKSHGLSGLSIAHLAYPTGQSDPAEEVPVFTLDDFVQRLGLTRLDFIKCDVEGAEFEVFDGGSTTLQRFRPVVFCEVHETRMQEFGRRPDDLMALFSNGSYTASRYDRDRRELDRIDHLSGQFMAVFLPERSE